MLADNMSQFAWTADAQGSTYWTLAFRRLDIDYAPAYAYPVPQAPPSPQT